jgi:hypothetical protein
LACFYWEPFARFLTSDGNGEPIALLEGVSVWPTVLLRCLAIILLIYFIFRMMRSLHNNLRETAVEMSLTPEPSPLWKQSIGIPNTLYKIARLFDYLAAQGLPLNVQAAWAAYVDRERFWPRFMRVTIYTSLMFGFSFFVLVPIFGVSWLLARSELAHMALSWSTQEEIAVMQFLNFLVFDATISCLRVVNTLRSGPTQWPAATVHFYKARLQLEASLVNDLITLDFVKKRTKAIGPLIYYPFVIMALLILSGSTMFGRSGPTPALIAQGISIFFVVGGAIALWWAAEVTRDTVRQNLIVRVERDKDLDGNDPIADKQLEGILNRIDQLKEGAFRPFLEQPVVRAVLLPLGGLLLPSWLSPLSRMCYSRTCRARCGFEVRLGSIATDPFGAYIVPRQEWVWKRT